MNNVYMYLLMLNPVAAEGPKDFLNDPDWGSIAFAGPIIRWIIGIVLALVVVAALVRGALLLMGLAGADRHKARNIGEGLLFCALAIFAAITFSDIFGTMITSINTG